MTAPAPYRLGNWLFENQFSLYRPLYAAWKSFSDRRERLLARQIVKPGMIVADVGANIGIYSLFFARLVAASGRVHAFEPAEKNFSYLRKAVSRHSNIVANNAAVGAHSGTATLYLSDELNVDHRMFDGGEGRTGANVRLVALDDYFPGGQRLDFIKIDVQGFEMDVLGGAARVLSDNADIVVLMEFWPYGLRKAGCDPNALIAFAKSLGFNVEPVIPGDISPEVMVQGSGEIDVYYNILLSRTGTRLGN